jgi:hypothetical protein
MQYPDGPVPGLPGMNAVDTRTRPPFTPWGKARFDAAKPMIGPRAVAGTENSPSLNCDPDGPPRVLLLPNPFEIVQIPGRVFMFFEEGHIWRTIWADGRPLPKDPDPSWLGYSVGHWEGDTFVVDTIGFNDKLWADPWGDPRSEKMHLTERYRRVNNDTLELQIIIDDPKGIHEGLDQPSQAPQTRAWMGNRGVVLRFGRRRALRQRDSDSREWRLALAEISQSCCSRHAKQPENGIIGTPGRLAGLHRR